MSTNTKVLRLDGVPSSLDDSGNGVVQAALQSTLVELVDLSLTGKQLHWTVRGPGFIAVHEQFDEVIDLLRSHADEVAERLTALGLVPDGRPTTVGDETPFDAVGLGAVAVDDALGAYVERIDEMVERLRGRIDVVGDVDPGSEDLLIALLQDLEKNRWLLAAGRS